tara:strand:+ start:2552 stop:4588 length:2037 start_codon:yes stop_codon:yes gene_type:complete
MKKLSAAIVQARVGSTRFPQKVIKEINGKTIIGFLIERLKICKNLDEIIIATTTKKEDDILESLGKKYNVKIIRGPSDDVLGRYFLASLQTSAENIIRITGDCPLIDPKMIESIISQFNYKNYEYMSNSYPPTFPDGLDIEIFKKSLLKEAHLKCKDFHFREHVTPWMREQKNLRKGSYKSETDYSNMRWTLDEPEDLEVIRFIVNKLNGRSDFSWLEVLDLEREFPDIFQINKKFKRNEGFNLGTGQKLYKRAKKVIPGGNMLLSKRPEMFLPEKWPSYFSKAKGCKIWDLDGNEYIDMSIMGIGTNVLGYGNQEIDNAVKDNINKGNMSTLNCPEEVILAEKLVEMHPWSDMVRFARSGGEANAIAIRIARAFSKKDKIAICGYHGWHDWYLATNLNSNDGLEKHLLPGLEPNGVPKALVGTVIPFKYNDLSELEKIVENHDLAAIKMEVERSIPPKQGFLEGVRELCNKKEIVLIFDECTSGFRETFGGIHLKYGVNPDIAMFGKALGNGYAITAVIGKHAIMQCAQETFISSTFWTERIGPTAALKTLEIMEKESSWIDVTKKGNHFRKKLNNLSDKYDLNLKLTGISSLISFQFMSLDNLKYKTYITQEMLKRGYLASTICYICTAHTFEIIDHFVENLDQIFSTIKECENGLRDINKLLDNDCCHSGFERLN